MKKELISAVFHKHEGRYGYRRIYLDLQAQGYVINHKKVQRIMGELDLKCGKFRRKSRYNSYKGKVGRVAKNRLNNSRPIYDSLSSSKTRDRCDGV